MLATHLVAFAAHLDTFAAHLTTFAAQLRALGHLLLFCRTHVTVGRVHLQYTYAVLLRTCAASVRISCS